MCVCVCVLFLFGQSQIEDVVTLMLGVLNPQQLSSANELKCQAQFGMSHDWWSEKKQ